MDVVPAPQALPLPFPGGPGAMKQAVDPARAIRWAHAQAVAPDGRRVGDVVGLVVDRQTGKPQWLLIHHRFHGHRCVPLPGIVGREGRVHVPYDAATIHDSVPVPEDGALSARHEQQLCAVYGVPPTRGAGLSKWERRRTASLARIDDDGTIRWEPPPRHQQDRLPVGSHGASDPGGAAGPSSILRVLIADPAIAAAQELRAVIDHHPRLKLIGMHRDGPQAITAAMADPPDVLVLSDHMPLLSGQEVRDRLHTALPHVVSVLLDDTAGSAAKAVDARTVRAPRALGPAQLVRVIEILAMTQGARSGASALTAHPRMGWQTAPSAG